MVQNGDRKTPAPQRSRLLSSQMRQVRPLKREKNLTTKLPRTTLGTGLARTGTNTGTPLEPPKRLPRGNEFKHHNSRSQQPSLPWVVRFLSFFFSHGVTALTIIYYTSPTPLRLPVPISLLLHLVPAGTMSSQSWERNRPFSSIAA